MRLGSRGASGASMAAALWLASCAPPDEVWTTRLSLVHTDAVDCRPPGPVDRIEVRALGDFPTTDTTVASLASGELEAVIDRFPVDTQRLVVEATVQPDWRAAGTRVLPPGDLAGDLVLLPFGRSCPVGDPVLHAPPGAAVAPLADGGLLLAGGSAGDLALRRVIRWLPGAQWGEPVGDGLHVTRTGATATPVDGVVVVAGGAQGETGVAHDTYEVHDPDLDAMVFGDPRLLEPRRDHAATPLPGGGVLLVGGVSRAGGAPLGTAEILDPAGGQVRAVEGALGTARRSPQAVTLDDGTVIVVGGRDAADAPVGRVEAFDPDGDTFVDGGCDVEARPGTAVALPGARLAWVVGGGSEPVRVQMVRRRPPYLPGRIDLACAELPLDPPPPALEGLRAAPLPDGRLLLTGEGAGAPEAWLIDAGAAQAIPADASRVPSHLVPLGDGAVAELDAMGASLHRVVVRTPFHDPPATLLLGSTDGVAFDLAEHWERSAADFVSVAPDARVDVPSLQFADVTLELDAAPTGPGAVQLLLSTPGAPPAVVDMGPDQVGPPFCTVPRHDGAPLRVTRTGPTVVVSAGGEPRTCTLPGLTDRVTLALRAQPGSSLRALRIAR
jgi:hypothetical protein